MKSNEKSVEIDKKRVGRESNFELLRLIAILMITAAHYFYYAYIMNGDLTGDLSGKLNEHALIFGKSFGQIGVALFIMISAYFLCKKKFNSKSFLKLILENIFYIIVIHFFILLFRCFYLHTEVFTFKKAINFIPTILSIFTLNNWFLAVYFCFYLIFPFLNLILNKITKNQLLFLISSMVLTLIVASSLQNIFIPNNMVITNLLWWFVIYYTAAYIRLYGKDFHSIWIPIVGMLVCIAVKLFFSQYTGYYENRNGFYVYFLSVFLFLLFKNIKIGSIKTVNLFASTTLGVYMLGDTLFLYQELIPFYKIYSSNYFWLISLGVIFGVVLVFGLIDLLRQYLLEKPLFKFLDKKNGDIYKKMDNLYPYEEIKEQDYTINKFLEPCLFITFVLVLGCQLINYQSYLIFIASFAVMMLVVWLMQKHKKKTIKIETVASNEKPQEEMENNANKK